MTQCGFGNNVSPPKKELLPVCLILEFCDVLLKKVITLLCILNIIFPQSYSHNACYRACNTVVVSMAVENT